MNIVVHPRGYGEHVFHELPRLDGNGSSPWVRGTLTNKFFLVIILRFIPVGTGNTKIKRFLAQTVTVHPRGYGEHALDQVSKVYSDGSSPWVRGTLNKLNIYSHI